MVVCVNCNFDLREITEKLVNASDKLKFCSRCGCMDYE